MFRWPWPFSCLRGNIAVQFGCTAVHLSQDKQHFVSIQMWTTRSLVVEHNILAGSCVIYNIIQCLEVLPLVSRGGKQASKNKEQQAHSPWVLISKTWDYSIGFMYLWKPTLQNPRFKSISRFTSGSYQEICISRVTNNSGLWNNHCSIWCHNLEGSRPALGWKRMYMTVGHFAMAWSSID